MSTDFANYIAGEWVASGDRSESHNPAQPDDVIGTFPNATREDVQRAVTAARAALPEWSATPERGSVIDRAARILEERLDDFAAALTREMGKTLAEARAEVGFAVKIAKFFAGEQWRAHGEVLAAAKQHQHLYTQHEPLGVISVITPFNFPVSVAMWKLAPALVYGNTVVFKPSPFTPHISLMLVQAFIEAGLPPGCLNFVTGDGPTTGDEMVVNPGVNGVTFTGSYQVGSHIYGRAIASGMKRVQLEMGGKNPMIVLDDADLDLAAEYAIAGAYGVAGQVCTATSRIIVEERIAEDFSAALTAAVDGMTVGSGLDEATTMGPVVSSAQRDKVLHYIEAAHKDGGRLLAGGDLLEAAGGYFVQPTVFDGVDVHDTIAQEEVFGPVVGLIRARDLDDAVEKANAVGYGLSASVITRDLKRAFQFADRVQAGIVKINQRTSGIVPHAPFGGFKNSSANTFKELGGAKGFYTRVKTVYMDYEV